MVWLSDILRQLALAAVVAWVRLEYPDVPTISTGQLQDRLGRDDPPPVLIDTRQEREYAVSHLPGALHLPTLAAVQDAGLPTEAPLVLYCTVGYRSAVLARQLQDAGYGPVANLQGSIIRWHQRRLPLVNHHGAARTVHPYDASWGRLLPADARAILEPPADGGGGQGRL